jgi:hypothetical protein
MQKCVCDKAFMMVWFFSGERDMHKKHLFSCKVGMLQKI